MKRAYAVPTSQLLTRWLSEPNPVTRSSLSTIIGERIDRHETDRLKRVLDYAKTVNRSGQYSG
jgi:hypothetical protein